MLMLLQLFVFFIMLPFVVLMHLVPALFQVFVWLTRYGFELLVWLVRRPVAHGALVLISGLLWAGIALLLVPLLRWVVSVETAVWLSLAIGAIWGFCVGQQAALLWQVAQWRNPMHSPGRTFGLPDEFFEPEASNARPRSMEDLWRDGIILGQTSRKEEG